MLKSAHIVSVLLAAGASSVAMGDIVFNNFGPGNAFSGGGRLLQGETVGSIGNVDQAVQFTVGGSDFALTSVEIGVFVNTPPNTGTGPIDLLVAADDAGVPGTVLRTLSLVANATGQQVLFAADNGTLTLTAGTNYWIIADARGSFDGGWGFNSIGDTGLTAGRSANVNSFNYGAWNTRPGDDRMALRVQGTLVPTPAGAALGGLAMLGLATRRRR